MTDQILIHDSQSATATPVRVDADESRRLLVEWNATSAEYPRQLAIHQLFEQNAASDAIAVVFGAQTLSYKELNERANKLAHYLARNGAGQGTVAGIMLDRSLETVV